MSKSKSKRAPSVSQTTKETDPADLEEYSADCMAGAMAARDFLKQMIDERAYFMLAQKVREIMNSGKFGGFEVGFFGEIARATTGGRALLLSEYYAFNGGHDPEPVYEVPPASA